MKKTILFIAFMLICFGIRTMAGNEEDCYVKVGDKVYVGQDIKIGPIHTKIISTDGSVSKIDNNEITAYRHHDKVYMLLPVICEYNDTLCMAMMQYIRTKGEFNVFKYCCPQNGDLFFVYKDAKFYRRINSTNAQEELAFYDVKVR